MTFLGRESDEIVRTSEGVPRWIERVVPVFLELGALVLLSYKGNCHHLTLDISLATDC